MPNIKASLIAPCGMDCGLCLAYLREKKHCPGCNFESLEKTSSCARCLIKKCAKKKGFPFCFACDIFPCARIKHIDKRYRLKYGMSMIENLERIKKEGIRKFIKSENVKWACPKCGRALCVHRDFCLFCGRKRSIARA